MKELVFQPIAGRTEEIIDTILQQEEIESCTKIIYPIHLACEEIIMNIVSYAYPDDVEGYVKIQIESDDKAITISFIDSGVAFDPLAKEMPDTSIPLEDRDIGGLGIFLTQQTMDDVTYQRVDDKNILTIKKQKVQ